MSTEPNKALECAVRLLARREHGAKELINKLQQKGYTFVEARDVLATCQEQRLQSDSRFVENMTRLRIRQGYGPVKITHELAQLGIDSDLIAQTMQQEEDQWLEHATRVWQKKNKGQELTGVALQKQQRFMQYRGFPLDVIKKIYK